MRKDNSPFQAGTFEIRENGVITRVYKTQGLDLAIEQQKHGEEPVVLSHYSNPGIAFYSGLLRFLQVHGIPIPKMNVQRQKSHDEFKQEAIICGRSFAGAKFPIKYQHYFMKEAIAELMPIYEERKPPFLKVSFNDGEIILSTRAVKTLIQRIPNLYPGFQSFQIARRNFLSESAKLKEKAIRFPFPKRRLRAKQLKFPFAAGLRKTKPR